MRGSFSRGFGWVVLAPILTYLIWGCIAFPIVLAGSLWVLGVGAAVALALRLLGPLVERWRRARNAREELYWARKIQASPAVAFVETGAPYRGGRIRVELPSEPARPTVLERTQRLLSLQPDPVADRQAIEEEAAEMEAELVDKMRR